jgi:hypothetical protein
MTWRGAGVALVGAGSLPGLSGQYYDNPGLGLLGFVLAVAGLALIVQGKRVPAALRIERSRHRLLPQAIRAHRRQRPDHLSGEK